jgi:hypothetical protein
MHPANVEKIEAPQKATLLPTTTPRDHEKHSLNLAEANSQPNNMPRIQRLCFTLLIILALGLTVVSAASSQQGRAISDAIAQEKLRFQQLLNSVEPSSLHEVLHTHMKDRYQHGVYQEDKHAMEVVHQENAAVAHSLLELAKRQTGGSNTTVIVTTTNSAVTETTTIATQTAAPSKTSDSSPPPSTSQSSQHADSTTTSSQDQQTSSSPDQSTKSALIPSTNGTFLGGPAAYPFAPPAPPASSSESESSPSLLSPSANIPVQNSSILATAAASSSAPSPSAYQFVQSSVSSSAMSTPSVINSSSIVSTSSIVPTTSAGLTTAYVLNSSSVVSTPSIVPTSPTAPPSILNSSSSNSESLSMMTTSCILNSSSIISPTTPPYPIPSSNSSSSILPSGYLNCSSGVIPPMSSLSSGSPSTGSPSAGSPSGAQGHSLSPSSSSSCDKLLTEPQSNLHLPTKPHRLLPALSRSRYSTRPLYRGAA